MGFGLVWNAFHCAAATERATCNVQYNIQHTACNAHHGTSLHVLRSARPYARPCCMLLLHAVLCVARCVLCCTLGQPAQQRADHSPHAVDRPVHLTLPAEVPLAACGRRALERSFVPAWRGVVWRTEPNRVVRACSKQNCELAAAHGESRRNTLADGCVLNGCQRNGWEQYTSRLLEYVPTTSSSTPSKSMSNSHAHITELKLRDRRTINSAQTVRSYSTCPPTRTLTQSHCCLWLCLRPLAGRDQPNQTKPHNPIRFAKA